MKLNEQEHIHNHDNGKYVPLIDANPMTQTILERVHGSGSMMTLRQNSVLTSNNLRRNSSENSNHSFHGITNLESSLTRQRRQSNDVEEEDEEDDDDDDVEST